MNCFFGKYVFGYEGNKVRVYREKSFRIKDGRLGILFFYVKDSILYFYKKVFIFIVLLSIFL